VKQSRKPELAEAVLAGGDIIREQEGKMAGTQSVETQKFII